ncbi:MAG: amino acid-binding protein [Planctomycetota bacterium]
MKNSGIRNDTQFSVFLVNKPGILARVCQQLAQDKVNILALSMMDSTEHGVLRFVAEDPQRARDTLAVLDIPSTESQVLVTTMTNHPGALADVVERLSVAHVNVNYAYCTAGAPGGKSLGVFRVSDLNKAVNVLSERKPRRKETPGPVRANGRTRRNQT